MVYNVNELNSALDEFNKIISIYKNNKITNLVFHNGFFIPIVGVTNDYSHFQSTIFIAVDINKLYSINKKNKAILGRKFYMELFRDKYLFMDVDSTYEFINSNNLTSIDFDDNSITLISNNKMHRILSNEKNVIRYIENEPINNILNMFGWIVSNNERKNKIKHLTIKLTLDDINTIINSNIPKKVKICDNKFIYLSKSVLSKRLCKSDAVIDLYYVDNINYGLFIISSEFDETYRYVIQFISIILNE